MCSDERTAVEGSRTAVAAEVALGELTRGVAAYPGQPQHNNRIRLRPWEDQLPPPVNHTGPPSHGFSLYVVNVT